MADLTLNAVKRRWTPDAGGRVHLWPDEIKADVRDLIKEVERLRTCLLACHNALTPAALREVHMHLSVDGDDDAAGEWAMRAMYNAATDPEAAP